MIPSEMQINPNRCIQLRPNATDHPAEASHRGHPGPQARGRF